MGYIQELRALVGQRPLILVAAGVIILDAQGRLLLQHRADGGLWGVPGGCMEIGETLEETARREVLEETGLEVGEMAFLTVISNGSVVVYPNGDQAAVVSAVYVTRDVRGELRINDDESLELRYFSRDQLESVELTALNKLIVAAFLQADLPPV